MKYYSLDVILAVGYRVRSPRGVQFRRWATERLREYLVKGFTMDDERLGNPPVDGEDPLSWDAEGWEDAERSFPPSVRYLRARGAASSEA